MRAATLPRCRRLTSEARSRVSSPSREPGNRRNRRFGDGQPEHGVADELELLVVGAGVGQGLGIGLVGEGAVGEGPGEQFGSLETMVEQTRGGLVRLAIVPAFLRRVRHPTLCILSNLLDCRMRLCRYNVIWR